MVSHPSVLGGLTVDRFLRRYWQQEPLVVRGAFPALRDPLTPDELAGLACEPHVESRLVMERGGTKPWQVIRGPQRAKRLQRLPRSHWTLLVESADRHSDEIAALSAAFSFLPNWRMDDVMVSLAPAHGTVEAHIDSYDVFLIQGQGRRRWEVDRRARPDYKPGLDLRILRRFRAQDAWVLEPGDMLYVPPGTGHRGVTVRSDVDIALTYSVGFRAPSLSDLFSSLLTRSLAEEAPRLFSDRGRRAARDPGELSAADLSDLRRFLLKEVGQLDAETWTLVAGESVTAGGSAGDPVSGLTSKALSRRLEKNGSFSPAAGARLSWASLPRGRAVLFVNGESRVLPREQAFVAPFLCGKKSSSSGRRLATSADLIPLALSLLRAGVVVLRDQG